MIFQNMIWAITLTGMGLVALGFVYAIVQAGRPAGTAEAARAHRSSITLRRGLFLALLLLGIGIAWASLRPFPIPLQHEPLQAAQVVNVVGHQWTWDVSETRLTVDEPVEFRVTSDDVNHGFAIYAPDGRIVIQTQAMPGFTNKILYTFRTPGTYRIMCLEYCGVAHNGMTAELDVAARGHKS
ncbi:cytochrome oxidase [Rhodanobacter sp. B2A1Ga4]|uniref:cytochrome oxidase n=1 Tax=Rhodanobacter TaxID=75309 RepID=UPI000D3B9C78|nr:MULTISPECIES: cytochrome oxidase [Rhodanobacter]MBQ4854047.1 cytochrome oxidase [Rhodanobacter sp. B2A1Ga4]